ncbi:hypothetical protein PENTCL1PPCAC_11262, partial [Pristionchus entomophagus]
PLLLLLPFSSSVFLWSTNSSSSSFSCYLITNSLLIMNPSLLILSIFFYSTQSQDIVYSIHPPQNAFFLYSQSSFNKSHHVLYLQDSCPLSTHQSISSSIGGSSTSSSLIQTLPSLNCAVSVHIVETTIRLDRPFIDVISLGDLSLLSFFRRPVCVNVKVTTNNGATIANSCQLSPFESDRISCLIRMQIPFTWFGPLGGNRTKQFLSLSYTVGSTCTESFFDRPQYPIYLEAQVENAQAHTLLLNQNIDISVLSRANLTFGLHSLNSLFVHLQMNETKETKEVETIEMKLFIDSRLDILNVSPLSPSDWTIKVVTPSLPQSHTAFICTRLKKNATWDGYLFAVLVKMRGNVAENERLERREEGAEAALHWSINIDNEKGIEKSSENRAVMKFRVTPDSIYAILPISKSRQLINSAVLSGHQISLAMRVFSVSLGGATQDVTSLSHCMSSESKVLKTSPACASVYVDGSEMRGSSSVKIHVHFETWVTDVAFAVWYPRLPVTVWLRDSTLNSVGEWPVTTWKQLESGRLSRSSAKQFSCKERFQSSEVKVLVSFIVVDDRTGERMFLSGSRDTLFDVTSMAGDRIHTSDRSIAYVRRVDSKYLVSAIRKGTTSVIVKSNLPQMTLGSTPVTVSDERVSVSFLRVLPLTSTSIGLHSLPSPPPSYALSHHIQHLFTHKYQHGTLAVSVVYSDDQSESIEDIPIPEFSLSVTSNDEKLVVANMKEANRIDLIALDDSDSSSVMVELRPSPECIDPDSLPISIHSLPLSLNFGSTHITRSPPIDSFPSPSLVSLPTEGWRLDTLLVILVLLFILVSLLRFITARSRSFTGYEKLVVPLLSRFSSSSSGVRGGSHNGEEEENEWVWLSKNSPQLPSNTNGSRHSSKSRRDSPSSPISYDCNTHTSISYRGSEISVFISPQPAVTVNGTLADRESWRAVHSNRSARIVPRNRMADSSSEHDLQRGMANDVYSGRTHTWNSGKRRSPPNYEGLRESIA